MTPPLTLSAAIAALLRGFRAKTLSSVRANYRPFTVMVEPRRVRHQGGRAGLSGDAVSGDLCRDPRGFHGGVIEAVPGFSPKLLDVGAGLELRHGRPRRLAFAQTGSRSSNPTGYSGPGGASVAAGPNNPRRWRWRSRPPNPTAAYVLADGAAAVSHRARLVERREADAGVGERRLASPCIRAARRPLSRRAAMLRALHA